MLLVGLLSQGWVAVPELRSQLASPGDSTESSKTSATAPQTQEGISDTWENASANFSPTLQQSSLMYSLP